jgi:hypothetical protein
MRKLTAVLLFCVVFACNKNETPVVDTTPATPEVSAPATRTDTAATATETPAATASPTTDTAKVPTTATAVTDTAASATPFELGPPPPQPSPKKYEYLVDTLYDWPIETQKIVVANTTYGAQFFNLANRKSLASWRMRQGYEKILSFDVPGAPTKFPNPFINAKHVVIVYRKAR